MGQPHAKAPDQSRLRPSLSMDCDRYQWRRARERTAAEREFKPDQLVGTTLTVYRAAGWKGL